MRFMCQQTQRLVLPDQGDALVRQRLLELAQHQGGNLDKVLLGQLVEDNNLIHSAQKFRAQELGEGLHHTLTRNVRRGLVEAQRSGPLLAAAVGGHDDDGAFKGNHSALRVGDFALIQNLQQDVHNVRVRLFNLVKEHHRVRSAANLFGQLAGLIVADIAGRRTDDAGHAVLFHKFGHIQADQRILLVEQLLRQRLDQLGLSYAGRADKNKGSRAALFADLHSGTANRRADQTHRLILADDSLLQRLLQPGHPLQLRLLNLAGRDAGPQLDHLGKVLVGDLLAQGLLLDAVCLALQLQHLGLVLSQFFVVDVLFLLFLAVDHVLVDADLTVVLVVLGQHLVAQVGTGAGLVQQVDCLIWQEAVVDVTFGIEYCPPRNIVGNDDAVEVLVVFFDAL